MIQQDEDQRTRAQRCADMVSEFCGSWVFVFFFSGLIIVWVILNSFLLLFGKFDEYPYIALNLVLTVVSTLQGPLMTADHDEPEPASRPGSGSGPLAVPVRQVYNYPTF